MDTRSLAKVLGAALLAIILLGLANGAAEQGILPKPVGIITWMGQILLIFFMGALCVKKLQLQVLHAAIAGGIGGIALASANTASYWVFSVTTRNASLGFAGAFVNIITELVIFIPLWLVIGCLVGVAGGLAASRGNARGA